MENVKHGLRKSLVQAVKRRARTVFAFMRNRSELVNDAISEAWAADTTAPLQATDKSLAYYACKRALNGRQFRQSIRSIDGPNERRVKKPDRETVPMGLVLTGKKDDPAEVAAVRIDFGGFMATLTEREKDFLLLFIYGETTSDIAKRMGCSHGRVSQIRRELVELWMIYTT